MTEFTEQQFIFGDIKLINNMESSIKQLCKGQDFTATLTIENKSGYDEDQPIDVVAVFDGHGSNLVIDIIRELNMNDYFTHANTAECLQHTIKEQIRVKKEKYDKIPYKPGDNVDEYLKGKIRNIDIINSGSTFSAAYIQKKINTDEVNIVAEWVGDSPIFVFVNGELVFTSKIHHASNDEDVALMKEKGFIENITESNAGFELVSEDTIISKPTRYIVFKNGLRMAMTRSLGHNSVMSTEAQTSIITAKNTDDVKVIVCSDGIGDVINLDFDTERLKSYSAEEIVNFAEKRWKQKWMVGDKAIKFPINGYDDCSCAIWWQKKYS